MKNPTALVFMLCLITLGACSNKDAAQPTDTGNDIGTAFQSAQISPVTFNPASLAVASPSKYQPASAAYEEQASGLLSQYKKACETDDAVLFFAIFTERVRFGFSRMSQGELTKYFSDACTSFPGLAADLASGVTISPDSYSMEDDQHISNMCAKRNDGVCKNGIDVGVEGGKLKLSEW